MGSGNLKRLKTQDLRLKTYGLCFRTCTLWFVICFLWSIAYCVSADSGLIDKILTPEKLKEEINLTGATLKEFVGVDPALSGLEEISLKTYILPTTPDDPTIKSLLEAHETGEDWRTALVRAVSTEYSAKAIGEGWQTIRHSIDKGRSVLICGKEKDGVRDRLRIIIIEPPEFSEMYLIGAIELSALSKLRNVIAQSMPSFDKPRPARSADSLSQRVPQTDAELRDIIKKGRQEQLAGAYERAESYKKLGRYENALQLYDSIINYDSVIGLSDVPEWIYIRTYQDAAESSERLGRFGDAEKYYTLLLEKFGDRGEIASKTSLSLERLRGWEQPEKRIELLAEAIERYSTSIKEAIEQDFTMPPLRSELGLVYQQAGMYEQALEQYKIVIDTSQSPYELAEAYLNAGKCSEALGMIEEAKIYYTILTAKYGGDDRQGVAGEKALIRIERGGSQPSLGIGLRFTGTTTKGVRITTVFKNGPAKAAGVQPGDFLLAIDSKPTPNARSVINIIGREKNIGDEVMLLIRRGAQEMETPVTLIKTPEKLER